MGLPPHSPRCTCHVPRFRWYNEAPHPPLYDRGGRIKALNTLTVKPVSCSQTIINTHIKIIKAQYETPEEVRRFEFAQSDGCCEY